MSTAHYFVGDTRDVTARLPDGSIDLVLTSTMYGGGMPKNASMDERFWEKVNKRGDDECWEWVASRDSDGYGRFQEPTPNGQRHIRAHRWAYTRFVGDLAPGEVVMHTCDNPPCVNPDHLVAGLPLDNNNDKVSKGRHAKIWGTPLNRARQTHCKRGHPFDEQNTRIMPTGHRRCRECERINAREWYWKNKARPADGGGDLGARST